MSKKLNELRPFSGEVVTGEKLLWGMGGQTCVVLGESNSWPNIPSLGKQYCIEHSGGLAFVTKRDLFEPPLCWVEDRPVYKGDVLWWRDYKDFPNSAVDSPKHVVTKVLSGVAGDTLVYDDSGKWLAPRDLTWKSPTVKKEAWVNVYDEIDGALHSTKDLADKWATKNRKACIRIEWEEEA